MCAFQAAGLRPIKFAVFFLLRSFCFFLNSDSAASSSRFDSHNIQRHWCKRSGDQALVCGAGSVHLSTVRWPCWFHRRGRMASRRTTTAPVDLAAIQRARASVAKVLCQSTARRCERIPGHRAAAALVDQFWTGPDGRNIAALAAWTVPTDYCRESTDPEAAIACYDCSAKEHLIFSESLRNHSMQTDGPLGKDRALQVTKAAIMKSFAAQRTRFLWTRLVALFKSSDTQLRIFALEALTAILRTEPTSDILIAQYAAAELTALMLSYPASLVQHAVTLLIGLTNRKEAVLSLVGQRVVHEAFEYASNKNDQAARFLSAMRIAVQRPDVRELIEYHLHCPPSLRTVDARFEVMACTGLVLLSDTRQMLLRNTFPSLFEHLLPDLLEASDKTMRVLGGKKRDQGVVQKELVKNEIMMRKRRRREARQRKWKKEKGDAEEMEENEKKKCA